MPATHVAGIVLHIQPEQLFLHSLLGAAFVPNLKRLGAYSTFETSTPSKPADSERASPPCASLILRRTSLAESA
jgi:hypothetical protein